MATNIFYRYPVRSRLTREFLAEFIGVTALCVLGNGSVAQQVLLRTSNFLSINIAYGIAVMFGAYLALGVTGGHINPAITVAFAVIGKFPWRKVPIYLLAQYLGGILSGLIVYLVYYDAHNNFDGGERRVTGENATAGIYATYPQGYLTITNAFFDQVLGTAILMMFVLAVTTERNIGHRAKGLEPLLIGLMIIGIGAAYGVNAGYAINPARDFGPRLFTAMAGWGLGVFSANNYFFWVPIIGPHVGAIIGAILYVLLLGSHFVHDTDPVYVREVVDERGQHVRMENLKKGTNGGGDTPLRHGKHGEEWVDVPETTPVQVQHR